ncbi:hypothetical protein [Nonomuraea aurantiaca]|uniref:hypothetical protein n=1 Tax=Nonomuraea aurantiaca TaxID=2878562 RepID=UPI001CD946FA|nr:hypothetical protein [Nonomuraea aurantiaca]MCA2221125.1 hypothetical protein [Nonomuraea aurantiaca]
MATTCLALAAAVVVSGTPVAAASTATAAGKTHDVSECFDGRCKITVTKPVSFPVSSSLGFTTLSITRVGFAVKVQGTGSGVSSSTTLSAGGNGSVGALTVRVLSITQNSATIRLAPSPR